MSIIADGIQLMRECKLFTDDIKGVPTDIVGATFFKDMLTIGDYLRFTKLDQLHLFGEIKQCNAPDTEKLKYDSIEKLDSLTITRHFFEFCFTYLKDGAGVMGFAILPPPQYAMGSAIMFVRSRTRTRTRSLPNTGETMPPPLEHIRDMQRRSDSF